MQPRERKTGTSLHCFQNVFFLFPFLCFCLLKPNLNNLNTFLVSFPFSAPSIFCCSSSLLSQNYFSSSFLVYSSQVLVSSQLSLFAFSCPSKDAHRSSAASSLSSQSQVVWKRTLFPAWSSGRLGLLHLEYRPLVWTLFWDLLQLLSKVGYLRRLCLILSSPLFFWTFLSLCWRYLSLLKASRLSLTLASTSQLLSESLNSQPQPDKFLKITRIIACLHF